MSIAGPSCCFFRQAVAPCYLTALYAKHFGAERRLKGLNGVFVCSLYVGVRKPFTASYAWRNQSKRIVILSFTGVVWFSIQYDVILLKSKSQVKSTIEGWTWRVVKEINPCLCFSNIHCSFLQCESFLGNLQEISNTELWREFSWATWWCHLGLEVELSETPPHVSVEKLN